MELRKYTGASLDTEQVWQQETKESLLEEWSFLPLKWKSQLARIKVAEPCLARVRSPGRGDLALDSKELPALSQCQQKISRTSIELGTKIHDATHVWRGNGGGRTRPTDPGLSEFLEELQLPLTMRGVWTPDGRWNTCPPFPVLKPLWNNSEYFACLVFWSAFLHKSAGAREEGRQQDQQIFKVRIQTNIWHFTNT